MAQPQVKKTSKAKKKKARPWRAALVNWLSSFRFSEAKEESEEDSDSEEEEEEDEALKNFIHFHSKTPGFWVSDFWSSYR